LSSFNADVRDRGPGEKAPATAGVGLSKAIVEQPPANIPFNVPAARPNISGEVRAEMQNRVASFRAHQQRFHRERDEYCSATLAKMRVLVSDDSAPAPLRE